MAMTDKRVNIRRIADIVCRSLLAIVAVIREECDLPTYHNITIEVRDNVDGFGYRYNTDGENSAIISQTK